jgi:5'-methylthioadenosine phosphorylase
MHPERVGLIGGSGMAEALQTLGVGEVHDVTTPFGKPSSPIVTALVSGVPVALLSRHGEGHRLNPSQVPYRANIHALKQLGVTRVLATTAVGSLREEIIPRHLVIPDQLIDRTFRRPSTFFDELAVHVEMGNPLCGSLRGLLIEAGKGSATPVHANGTYVCMEGPQFSTRAESELHRSWGAQVIGMTAMPEAKLAREAELCYALISLPTDYDSWRPGVPGMEQQELLQEILGNLRAVTRNAVDLIRRTLPAVAALGTASCPCRSALKLGIWSNKAGIPPQVRERLALLLGKYL